MRFHKGNADIIKPFALKQEDGTTVIDITTYTVTWVWIDRDGNQPTGSPITGNKTTPTSGEVEFTIPSTMLASKAKYRTFINLATGGYNEDLDPFNVEVVEGTG